MAWPCSAASRNRRAASAKSCLGRLDAWLAGRDLDDGRLAAYLTELFEAGRAASIAAMAVAAARLRAKLAGDPDPAGPATGRVLAGFRRRSADRGRGQAAPCSAANLAAIFATVERPRRSGRGLESAARAAGIEPRLTAHSGLATELTARGASAHDVMRAGNWKTVRMVAHYSDGASAGRGAVARYL